MKEKENKIFPISTIELPILAPTGNMKHMERHVVYDSKWCFLDQKWRLYEEILFK